MLKINDIFAIFVIISLVFAGFSQSSSAAVGHKCPMAASMADSAKSNSATPCANCPKMTEQQKSKGNCCGDDKCSKQCSTMNISSIFMPVNNSNVSYLPIGQDAIVSYSTLLPSLFLNTQDRPPKYLS